MKIPLSQKLWMMAMVLTLGATSNVWADDHPYYYGSYNPNAAPGSDNPVPPPAPTVQPEPPPPVVYRTGPRYRRARVYRESPWASDDPAALGPWPWNFDFGGGPTAIAGSNSSLTGGSSFEFGGGYNFTPQSGFVLEFMNSRLGLTDSTMQQAGAIDGDAAIWSVTLNPIWRFNVGGPVGAYIIGGGGYYERETRLDEPFTASLGRGFFESGIQTVRDYDDAGGINIGGGLTCNLGWGTKFFVEARYHYIFTSGQATKIIPITFGLRW